VVGVWAEGMKMEVGRTGLGLGVVELGATAGFVLLVSLNRLVYKNNSKILFRKLI
jgi:hypothetical protein